MTTNVTEFFSDLDGGVFEQKLARALSDAAGSVIDHDKKGGVTIDLKFRRIGNSYQVAVSHKLTVTRPTQNGEASEKNTTETPLHVGTGGRLTLFPENQEQMFTKTGDIATPTKG